MALTQQLARVAPAYLERCRAAALASPDAAPGWDPPREDLLDTDWAMWGLIRYCRSTGAAGDLIALLDRAISGDPGGDIGFLDHAGMYDGFDGPPRLVTPTGVTDIAHCLDAVDLDGLLRDLPAAREDAVAACGFDGGFNGGFDGDVRSYLVTHFSAMREFYAETARRGQCVVAWVD